MEMAERLRNGMAVTLFIAVSLFAFLNVWYPLVPMQERALFALIGMGAFFLSTKVATPRALAADTVHLLLTIVVFGHIVLNWRDLLDRQGEPILIDIIFGTIGVYLIMVATVRSLGRSLAIVVVLFLLYTFFGQHLPIWLGGHRGYSIERIFTFVYSNENGILGFAIDASLKFMALFVVMGKVLEYTGTLQFVTGLAGALFGRGTTGPPLVCVMSSALIGTVGGSAMGSVYITGQMTIPMMKRVGLSPALAAAIEATAANGAQILPPVLGFAAFFMVALLDVSYGDIIIASTIPGILYYVTLGVAVWSRSRRLPPPPDLDEILGERPKLSKVLFTPAAIGFIATATVLTWLLIERDSLQMSAIWAMVVCIGVTMFGKDRMTPKKAVATLSDSGREMVEVIVVTLALGLITGPILLTGLGTKLPALMIDWAQGDVTTLLICAFFASMILGAGMPTSMAYVIVAILITEPITKLGVPKLDAHMFVFYAALAAMITPPVGLAAYAAATIAKSDFWETGWLASMLGVTKYLVPFAFVFRPELLMRGEPWDIIWVTLVSTVGLVTIALGFDQVDKRSLLGLIRPLPLLVGGFLIAVPPMSLNVILAGSAMTVIGTVIVWLGWRAEAARQPVGQVGGGGGSA
jgi:TRAP transporter 4TM/12TM fusion protein